MGNCQAAEAATVVIQHPAENRVDRFYWSVSAHEVMNSNPGHYVALVAPSAKTENATTPVKQLKLLKPSDTLLLGQVYRLISFEGALKSSVLYFLVALFFATCSVSSQLFRFPLRCSEGVVWEEERETGDASERERRRAGKSIEGAWRCIGDWEEEKLRWVETECGR
ncbi:unnamed protein product [Linum tenue]|uniref:Uncharacterized protein n=1 Tax=Linum tenue TaxID=586396 RepID=A0AAV0L9V5_9ROSI|nr:unnamed protein product [Linum tenue]